MKLIVILFWAHLCFIYHDCKFRANAWTHQHPEEVVSDHFSTDPSFILCILLSKLWVVSQGFGLRILFSKSLSFSYIIYFHTSTTTYMLKILKSLIFFFFLSSQSAKIQACVFNCMIDVYIWMSYCYLKLNIQKPCIIFLPPPWFSFSGWSQYSHCCPNLKSNIVLFSTMSHPYDLIIFCYGLNCVPAKVICWSPNLQCFGK